ncbi:hypothetical protein HK27_07475 [Acetobacter orientalis]|uniref:hypothetical protein n=1 Tax=Acetobacter orientalis TaxID=146474 RepID=UPI000A377A62|nr:hypothetical protein [Acetobacter orientalis]OUJ15675.1 hypothetical protein HK27_07475 [Acetobacter orientalis]
MIPLKHIQLFSKYFSAFDRHLIRSMETAWPETETAITRNFWAMLNGDEEWKIDGIDGNPTEWLVSKLSHDGFDFSFSLRPHAGLEAEITFADFGIHFVYEDKITKNTSESCYIVQAKSLYRNPRRAKFNINDKFVAACDTQRLGLHWLGKIIGGNAVKYMAYCPRLSAYETSSQQAIRALHAPNIGSIYVGNQFGLALTAELRKGANCSSDGVWLSPASQHLHTAGGLHKEAFDATLPFGWFVISNLYTLSGYNFSDSRRIIYPWYKIFPASQLYTKKLEKKFDLAKGLALCDDGAIDDICSISKVEKPKSFFRPAATLTIRVSRSPQMELDLEPRPDADGDDFDDPSL